MILEILISFIVQPSVYVYQNNTPIARVVEAHDLRDETLREKSDRVARETNIDKEVLWNLVLSESLGGTRLEGDNGESCGVVHINKNYWPEEHKKCYDEEFSLRFAANLIKENREYLFTSCNCYQFAKWVSGFELPKMAEIAPNSYAFEGAVIIMKYGETKHLGVISELREDVMVVREANYVKCSNASREVAYDDPKIVGFWSP